MDKPEQKFKVGDRVYCNGGCGFDEEVGKPKVIIGATITDVFWFDYDNNWVYILEYDVDLEWGLQSHGCNLVLKSTIDEMFESFIRVYGK